MLANIGLVHINNRVGNKRIAMIASFVAGMMFTIILIQIFI